MNRRSKYIALSVALLTVLAAIMVTLGGRLGGEDGAEATADVTETAEPENTGYVTEPEPEVPAPSPPSAPEAGGALGPPSAPGAEGTPEPVEINSTHAVVVTAGPGGSVEPRGIVAVEDGGSVSFAFTPDAGFEVSEVKADGRVYDSPEGFSFSNVHESHTLYVVFREIVSEPEPTETPEGGGENDSDREMTDDEHTEDE